MEIEWVRRKALDVYSLTNHAQEECVKKDISLANVKQALIHCKILEQPANRQNIRVNSCLVQGYGADGKPLHIVVARNTSDVMVVKTVSG